MDDKPKSIWKKSFAGRMALVTWLAVAVFTIMLGCFITALAGYNGPMSGWLTTVMLFAGAFLVVCLILIYLVWPLLRWLFFKHWRRTLFALACFATLIALFHAEENWRGKHDWEKFKREWEAKGEHFDYASVVPPSVPDDQNFAFSPVWIAEERYLFQNTIERAKAWYGDRIYSDEVSKIILLLPVSVGALVGTNWAYHLPPTPDVTTRWTSAGMTDLKPWQSYYRNLETTNSSAEIPITHEPQSPAADVLLALTKYDPVIEKLRTDSALQYSRFPLSYEDKPPAVILLPHLAALKRYTQVLQLRAIAEMQNGETEKALEDVKLSLRLVDSIRTEPFLISHLVRIAMMNLTLQPVWEGLAEHRWSDAQLAELDQALGKIDFLTDFGVAMRGERACQISLIDYLQRNRSLRKLSEFSNMMSDEKGYSDAGAALARMATVIYGLAPSGWFEQNKLRTARFETENYLPLANVETRMVSPESVQSTIDAFDKEVCAAQLSPYNWFEKKFMPALAQAVKKFAYAQTSVDLARVAIALERYRLAHEEYPESLDTLAPKFMIKIPHDILNGQPLQYRREANGQFVLYSVGWNEKDDGGVVAFKEGKTPTVDINQGDWVWRYPAK